MSWCIAKATQPAAAMKRRNPDTQKLRKIKKNRLSDGVCSGSLIYMKLLVAWTLLLMADFLLGFRFEYLWPFWLLLRSIYDSFRYQGVAFSVFFVCMTVTSDLVCFLFIPVQWLFFLASTYVWVQYVWHADRGICLPTVSLWLLFIYVEASVRLKELNMASRAFPFTLDLCRPFAAHCIGYPVVTLGFGVKSYVGYKFRLRKQREVAKENKFYDKLLAEALPSEYSEETPPPSADADVAEESGGGTLSLPSLGTSKVSSTAAKANGKTAVTTSRGKSGGWTSWLRNWRWGDVLGWVRGGADPADLEDDDDDESEEPTHEPRSGPNNHHAAKARHPAKNKNPKRPNSRLPRDSSSQNHCSQSQPPSYTKDSQVERASDDVGAVEAVDGGRREELLELERVRSELRSGRALEADLRAQVASASASERALRSDASAARSRVEALEGKLANLGRAREQERATIQTLERKLVEEQRTRRETEAALDKERKRDATKPKAECTEACRSRRRELDNDLRLVRRDLRLREDQLLSMEGELKELKLYKEKNGNSDLLLSALENMRDKNVALQKSLSAENRLKQDLFSALGEANRKLELAQKELAKKSRELAEEMARAAGGSSLEDQNLQALAATVAAATNPFLTNGLGLNGLGNGLSRMDDDASASPALSFTPPRSL